jgi:putative transposase
MSEPTYPSDMTDDQWERLAPLIPPAKIGGRPRTVDIRAVVDAICYRIKTGCQWRQMPRDFPPWGTVAGDYRIWRRNGTWEMIHDALREQVRVKAGRAPTPRAAIIDSQSVKTTEKGGRAATMAASRSRDASGTSSSTRSG